MCEPVTIGLIASAAITAVQGVMQYKATEKANEQQSQAIQANVAANDSASQVQQNQINEQASQQMGARALAAMQERGKLRAVAADSGLGGNSQERLIAGTNIAENTDMATLEANRLANTSQSQRSKTSDVRQGNQQIAAMPQPSLLGVGLQIAGAATDAYTRTKTPANKASAQPFESGYPG